MRTVIFVIGKDVVGILARVSAICYECNVNIVDVTQTVLQDLFAMTMLADISKCSIPFDEFCDKMTGLGDELGLTVRTMHEDIFNSMHRI